MATVRVNGQYTDQVWYTWTTAGSGTTTGCTTSGCDNDITWNYWLDTANTAGATVMCSTYGTGETWTCWNVYTPIIPKLTRAQIKANRLEEKRRSDEAAERSRKWQAEQKERERLAKEAEQKALATLKENLDEQNIETLEKEHFIMVSVTSGNRYKINKGRTRNIEQVDEQGKRIKFLCVHPRDSVPDYDTMLSQKLMLENCEEEVRKIANFS